MTALDPLMDPLRGRVRDLLGANAMALRLAPASGPRGPDDSYEVALGPIAKAGVKGLMHASGADAAFERTIGRMTGGTFTPAEIQVLEDKALTAARPADIGVLTGITEGPPVTLNPAQKAVVDRIMGGLGQDPLSGRARDAYGGALRDGQVRTR